MAADNKTYHRHPNSRLPEGTVKKDNKLTLDKMLKLGKAYEAPIIHAKQIRAKQKNTNEATGTLLYQP